MHISDLGSIALLQVDSVWLDEFEIFDAELLV